MVPHFALAPSLQDSRGTSKSPKEENADVVHDIFIECEEYTHSMDTGYGLSDFTYPVSVPATEPAYEAYHYDNSSLNSSSPSSSAPHTPSIDVHLNTSFCQSLTAASSGDSLRQPAPTYLQVPIANPVTRTRSLQDRRGSRRNTYGQPYVSPSQISVDHMPPQDPQFLGVPQPSRTHSLSGAHGRRSRSPMFYLGDHRSASPFSEASSPASQYSIPSPDPGRDDLSPSLTHQDVGSADDLLKDLSLSRRHAGNTLSEYNHQSTVVVGSGNGQHHSMSNWTDPTTGAHTSNLDDDSFPYPFTGMQGGPSNMPHSSIYPFTDQFQSGFGASGDTPYGHMPQSSANSGAHYNRQSSSAVGDWQQRVRYLSGPDTVAIPPSPALSPSMTLGSTSIHSEDPQSQKDPDPLSGYKKIVFEHLQDARPLEDVYSRIRDLVERTGDIKYEEVLESALRERPDIAAPGLNAALKRRKNMQEQPQFACVLCRAFLTTNDNLKNHYRSHLKWDAFACQRCGGFFRTAATLKRHNKSSKRCIHGQHFPVSM